MRFAQSRFVPDRHEICFRIRSKCAHRFILAIGLVASFLLTSCQSGKESLLNVGHSGRNVRLYAAASTIDVVTEICDLYRKEAGIQVETSFAASSAQAAMLIQGARADLFLSASVQWSEAVKQEFPNAEVVKLLGNRLVLIVPNDSKLTIQSIADLKSAEIRKIAIADYKSVPAGVYAKQAIDNAGLWESVSEKLVGTMDVRQALTMVENGVVDCGLVYQTDVGSSQHVRVVAEVTGHDPVIYPLLLFPQASTEGRAFFEFLQSNAARTVFESHGFQALPVPSGLGPVVK